jgi:hypothetical protein
MMMGKRAWSAAVLLCLVALTGLAAAPGVRKLATAPSTARASDIDPSDFTPNVDNVWFPLTPGTTKTFQGTKDDRPALENVLSTTSTTVIDGVTVRVVKDNLFLDGKLFERTEDWFAQDKHGTVWFFGEDTALLDAQGNVTSTRGSWTAGVNGAQPGIVMPGKPKVGGSFQQEFSVAVAEDHFVVLNLVSSVTVPFGSFDNVLLTADWTPLEPDVLATKHSVKGIGLVREADVTGGVEVLELTKITSG